LKPSKGSIISTYHLQEGVENHICGARGAVCGWMLSSFSYIKEK
jgi:hypothetical protein